MLDMFSRHELVNRGTRFAAAVAGLFTFVLVIGIAAVQNNLAPEEYYPSVRTPSRLLRATINAPTEPSAIITTPVSGEPVRGDVDGDGDMDAVLVAIEEDGRGTFYYLAALINEDGAFRGTNGILLGDRIVPQATEIRGGTIIQHFLDRALNEPLTAKPGVPRTLYARIVNGVLETIQP